MTDKAPCLSRARWLHKLKVAPFCAQLFCCAMMERARASLRRFYRSTWALGWHCTTRESRAQVWLVETPGRVRMLHGYIEKCAAGARVRDAEVMCSLIVDIVLSGGGSSCCKFVCLFFGMWLFRVSLMVATGWLVWILNIPYALMGVWFVEQIFWCWRTCLVLEPG